MSTRAFRVKFNGGDSSLYVLVTAEEESGKVVAISTNYPPNRWKRIINIILITKNDFRPARWRIWCSEKRR